MYRTVLPSQIDFAMQMSRKKLLIIAFPAFSIIFVGSIFAVTRYMEFKAAYITPGLGGVIDVRGVTKKCHVHDRDLLEDKVSIHYGYPLTTEEYSLASSELFPFANSYYLGGCVRKPELSARVMYCPDCRLAEKEWERVHGYRGNERHPANQ